MAEVSTTGLSATGGTATGGSAAGAWWRADTATALLDGSIGDTLARCAAATPDRPAVLEWSPRPGATDRGVLRATTYRELHEGATRVAREIGRASCRERV